MAQSQNTVRELLIGTAIASETTLDTFKASADPGEIGIFAFDGTALDDVKPFVVAQKTADSVFVSDVIYPERVRKVTSQTHQAEQLRSVTVGSIVATAGVDYILDIFIYEHGSLSRKDVYIKFAAYKAKAGDNAEAIVDGLIASLNRNFSREPGATPTSNPLFTFSKTGSAGTAALVITAKSQPYVRGKKFARPIFFDVLAKFSPATATVTVTAGGHPGRGTGPLVAAMEFDLRKNRGDKYGDLGWPYTFPVITRANEAGQFDLIDILHDRGHDGWNEVSMRKVTSIAFNTGGGRLASLLDIIETATKGPSGE